VPRAPGAGAGLCWWWRWCRCGERLGLGLGEGLWAGGAIGALGAGWLLTVAAGAVRANTAAKPTLPRPPSWMARHVRPGRARHRRERAPSRATGAVTASRSV